MERGADRSHAAATGFTPPPGVEIHPVPPETDIGEMLMRGEIDATLLHLNKPNLVDRSRVDLDNSEIIRPLFADPAAEGRRYHEKTGIFPINHLAVVGRSMVEQHPVAAAAPLRRLRRGQARGRGGQREAVSAPRPVRRPAQSPCARKPSPAICTSRA